MKLTLEQLRSQTWPTREAAIKALRQAGVPARGADYELAARAEDDWQLLPLDDAAAPEVADNLPPVHGAKRSAAARIRSTRRGPPPDDWGADDPPNGARAPVDLFPTADADDAPPPAGAEAEAEMPEAEVDADDDGAGPWVEPDDGTNLSPLPSKTTPYYSVVIEARHIRQTGAVTHAHDVARRIKLPVLICEPHGEIVRRIDPAAVNAMRRKKPST